MVGTVTQNLIDSLMLDIWPRSAAIVDFGLDSVAHYSALQRPIRAGEITADQLQDALGDGKKLTALANSAPSNADLTAPVVFSTSWDVMAADDDAFRNVVYSGEPPTPFADDGGDADDVL